MSQDEIKNCQVQTRITPTMICPVDRTWYFLSHNMNTDPPQILKLPLLPHPLIIMIIVHPSNGLSFYVDGSLKLMWVKTDGKKKQVLVIQTIVPPEILLPDWNQGLVGLLIDYITHHRGPASSFGVSWQTGTTPFSAQVCPLCKLIVVNQID